MAGVQSAGKVCIRSFTKFRNELPNEIGFTVRGPGLVMFSNINKPILRIFKLPDKPATRMPHIAALSEPEKLSQP